MPAPLDRCSRELGGGALDRLLLLHSVLASSLQVSPHVQGAPACWAAERGPWAWPGRVPLGSVMATALATAETHPRGAGSLSMTSLTGKASSGALGQIPAVLSLFSLACWFSTGASRLLCPWRWRLILGTP